MPDLSVLLFIVLSLDQQRNVSTKMYHDWAVTTKKLPWNSSSKSWILLQENEHRSRLWNFRPNEFCNVAEVGPEAGFVRIANSWNWIAYDSHLFTTRALWLWRLSANTSPGVAWCVYMSIIVSQFRPTHHRRAGRYFSVKFRGSFIRSVIAYTLGKPSLMQLLHSMRHIRFSL